MWNKELVQALLDNSDKAVFKALHAIYARQTADEQRSQYTTEVNGVGFSKHDAEILSDIARKSLRWGGLTANQTTLVRRKIRRYWRQLVEIANTECRPVPEKLLALVAAQAAGEVAAAPKRAAPVSPTAGLALAAGDHI